mmetsp:Transcript_1835/g.6548  ORF Transcript_1835/g.6548 Transcript_1835/m.6548 type:complete len:237 (+) Transcript_1835:285-995(+)
MTGASRPTSSSSSSVDVDVQLSYVSSLMMTVTLSAFFAGADAWREARFLFECSRFFDEDFFFAAVSDARLLALSSRSAPSSSSSSSSAFFSSFSRRPCCSACHFFSTLCTYAAPPFCWKDLLFVICATNGCWSSSSAEGLALGSFWRQRLTKSTNSSLHCAPAALRDRPRLRECTSGFFRSSVPLRSALRDTAFASFFAVGTTAGSLRSSSSTRMPSRGGGPSRTIRTTEMPGALA